MAKCGQKPKNQGDTPQPKRRRPAVTIEERENQLISLATDLAEKQLREGTASAQVITHYLKLGSTREQAELEKLRRENTLLEAKTEALESSRHTEELYQEAIKAFRSYSRDTDPEDNDA